MEGGNVGPTTTTNNSRPVRTSSRYSYSSSSSSTFSGPVRRWEKKWVHVSSSQPSTKPLKKPPHPPSNAPKSLLLCKWTPLSRPSSVPLVSGDVPPRKVRFTPIAVLEEQKKLAARRIGDKDHSEGSSQSEARPAKDSDDMYGMLDINNDAVEAHEGNNESRLISYYSRRNQLNHESHSEKINKVSPMSGF